MPTIKLEKSKRPHKWRTTWNNRDFPSTGEVSFLPTETRPDEVMSIREIERRYANGRSLFDVLPRPVWDTPENDPDFSDYLPDIAHLDHADRMELLESTKIELDEIKKRANDLAAANKAKRDAKAKEDERLMAEKIAALLAAKQPPAEPLE